MALSSYIRSSFLRVAEIERPMEFVVESVREHTFTPAEGDARTSLCMFFINGQALSLSQHHLRALMGMGYEEEEELIGTTITLSPGNVDYKGESIAAITIASVA